MQARHRKNVAVAALALLAGCGGGGGDGSTSTATVIGPITGFGSVVVNGIHFDDSNASVTIEDATGAHSGLRLGMVVQIQGQVHSDGTGVANQIRYNDCVEGPITAMNRVQNTVTVMGETVHLDADTVFDGVALRDMNAFAIGDLVEVSCMPAREQNRMRASRMERKGNFVDGTTPIELTGTVANLDPARGTCTVGATPVNFAGIAAADRPQGLANGMNVEASGKRFKSGVLLADRLRDRDRDRIHVPDGDLFEVQGYVAGFVSIAEFTVDGYAVDASDAVIRNGTGADLADGVKVEVEGTTRNGVLIASLVVIKLQTNVQVEAGMQAKDAATLTLLGRPVWIDADTVLVDRLASGTQPQRITLGALNVGDRLEVKATRDSGGALVANSVVRTEADPRVVVKAAADAKTPVTRLTLSGFAVATGANTRYRDPSGALIDATSFYNLVQIPPRVPSIVHARGVVPSLATNVVDATRSTSTTGELELTDD
jgi:hypothetical protein